jgi:hypothetical protein
MDPTVIVAIIGAVSTTLGILIPIWYRQRSPKTTEDAEPKAIEGSGHVGQFVFNWMDLSEGARKKLGQSRFIRIGGTENALMTLVRSASDKHSILAICGYKGSYSKRYYEENFKRCKAVRRVFSYEAMRHEIKEKNGQCYALRGLEVHVKHVKHVKAIRHTDDDDLPVQVFVLPEGKLIRDLRGDFDPPYSFGLAILIDGNDIPKKAVIHWETDAKRLRDLINIEGVIVDPTQEELLDKLVRLYESIAHGDGVLSSSKNPDDIDNICTKLNGIWQERQSQLGKEEVKG